MFSLIYFKHSLYEVLITTINFLHNVKSYKERNNLIDGKNLRELHFLKLKFHILKYIVTCSMQVLHVFVLIKFIKIYKNSFQIINILLNREEKYIFNCSKVNTYSLIV